MVLFSFLICLKQDYFDSFSSFKFFSVLFSSSFSSQKWQFWCLAHNFVFFHAYTQYLSYWIALISIFWWGNTYWIQIEVKLGNQTKNGFKIPFFMFSYRFVKQHNLLRIYYSFDLIKVVVNISESFMSVYLCSLKSSLGVKQKMSAILKLLVQKKFKYRL